MHAPKLLMSVRSGKHTAARENDQKQTAQTAYYGDFEQVLSKYRPMLLAWYTQMVNELKTMSAEDISLFFTSYSS